MTACPQKFLDMGLRAGETLISEQDRIWCRNSNDKADIGRVLQDTLRALYHCLPLKQKIKGLSIGSAYEPQMQILQAACQEQLILLDNEMQAVQAVAEVAKRQNLSHVSPVVFDYMQFLDKTTCDTFFETELKGMAAELILFHHSLYYCQKKDWSLLLSNVYRYLLADVGGMHCVMMSARSNDKS